MIHTIQVTTIVRENLNKTIAVVVSLHKTKGPKNQLFAATSRSKKEHHLEHLQW